MPNTYTTKNYSTDNGDTLVIGGKLIIEEGAEVTGLPDGESDPYTLPAATASDLGGVKLTAAQAALENNAELADVITAFNTLIAALKTAGVMASE